MAMRTGHFRTFHPLLVYGHSSRGKFYRQESFLGIRPEDGVAEQIQMSGNIKNLPEIKPFPAMGTSDPGARPLMIFFRAVLRCGITRPACGRGPGYRNIYGESGIAVGTSDPPAIEFIIQFIFGAAIGTSNRNHFPSSSFAFSFRQFCRMGAGMKRSPVELISRTSSRKIQIPFPEKRSQVCFPCVPTFLFYIFLTVRSVFLEKNGKKVSRIPAPDRKNRLICTTSHNLMPFAGISTEK